MIRKGSKVRYSGHDGAFKGEIGKVYDVNGARNEYCVAFPVSKKRTVRALVPVSRSSKRIKIVAGR